MPGPDFNEPDVCLNVTASADNGHLCEAACQALTRHGFLMLNAALPQSLIADLHACCNEHSLGNESALRDSCLEVGDHRYMITFTLAGPFADPLLYGNPHLLPILQRMLGDDLVLDNATIVCAFPGAAAQHVHRDHGPLFPQHDISRMLPPHALTVAIPLLDLEAGTGTTAVWPGSHRQLPGPNPVWNWDDAFVPYPRAGAIYVMDYRLVHAGTANRSQQPRPILYLVYTRPWFTDACNFQRQGRLQISDEDLAAVPAHLQSLFARKPRADLT